MQFLTLAFTASVLAAGGAFSGPEVEGVRMKGGVPLPWIQLANGEYVEGWCRRCLEDKKEALQE